MDTDSHSNNLVKNTTHKVVLPFYIYSSASFFISTVFLFFSVSAFTQHFFHPQILAITHMMALGWGTMVILGASHQLVPVLIEGKLYSITLAYLSFVFAAAGIPLLVYGFYVFDMGWPAQLGGLTILISILLFVINVGVSVTESKVHNVHAFFVFTAALWLLITVIIGVLLVFNFTHSFLSKNSTEYLPLHAHLGIAGWFLLLVIGVGSRLIPMFLISKYSNEKLLWIIYCLINAALLTFIGLFLYWPHTAFLFIPVLAILLALFLFAYYCYRSFKERIRKQVDAPMKTSLLSVVMMIVPFLLLFIIVAWLMLDTLNIHVVIAYGFVIFFGWLTSIILGMTFKTLPFIVWNKIYRHISGAGKTPSPKDLFANRIFGAMIPVYLLGFVLFVAGICAVNIFLMNFAAVLLMITAFLYNWNVLKVLLHKPVKP
ncbi:MAG: cytochrome c oxidase subunit I [Bacteroidota bacterium]|nr:cytochrome c oxidase subunit I [Bacteroidota bacterium]